MVMNLVFMVIYYLGFACEWCLEKVNKYQITGDSSRDLFILHLEVTIRHWKGHAFTIPKKVTLAELPGISKYHPKW